jgi:hypothetical protein
MKISHAMTGRQTDSKENSNIQPKIKWNIGCPHLRWRDHHTLQEDGTDHVWPNP